MTFYAAAYDILYNIIRGLNNINTYLLGKSFCSWLNIGSHGCDNGTWAKDI